MREIQIHAECLRCGAEFSGTYESYRRSLTVCLQCHNVDGRKSCRCPQGVRYWRFDDCPLCLGPIQISERLLPPL